jgi:hypothetical protein
VVRAARRYLFSLSPFLRGEGWGEGMLPRKWRELDSRKLPLPDLLRKSTSPRIRLRQEAGFGRQERGEVKKDHAFRASNAIRTASPASTVPIR